MCELTTLGYELPGRFRDKSQAVVKEILVFGFPRNLLIFAPPV
jgi:hypothetical protein